MRWGWVWLIVGIGISASSVGAEPFVKSNDTGGIISWSCEAEAEARAIAFHECARFDKYPRITSVHRRYGDFIAFNCLWSPYKNPYALPAVHTRANCAYERLYPRVRVLN